VSGDFPVVSKRYGSIHELEAESAVATPPDAYRVLPVTKEDSVSRCLCHWGGADCCRILTSQLNVFFFFESLESANRPMLIKSSISREHAKSI